MPIGFRARFGAPLLERVTAEAPRVRIAIIPPARGADPTELLESERADVAIMGMPLVPPPLRKAPLYEQGFVCVARRNHPRVHGRLSLARFAAASHVLVAPFGAPGSIVDDALARHERSRTVAMRVSTFASALAIVASTDFVSVIPDVIANRFAASMRLQVSKLPLDVPAVPIGQVWHPRVDHDDAHRWFRGLLTTVAASGAMTGAPRRSARR